VTELTIDELARQVGMTGRNIRAHQARGLLPPPEVRGRTGYYGDEHVARLQMIREMQADGYNLAAIKNLLEGTQTGGEAFLGFKRAVLSPFGDERPEIISAAELAERFPGDDGTLLRRAEKLGLLVLQPDGSVEVPSPTLLRAGEDVVSLGVPLEEALDVLEQINRGSATVAKAFVALFIRHVMRPFQDSGQPAEELAKVHEALERLRPLASEALLAAFQQVMTQRVEEAFGRELQRGSKKRS
jgi:DNA-binding transcriptional MerR regulator